MRLASDGEQERLTTRLKLLRLNERRMEHALVKQCNAEDEESAGTAMREYVDAARALAEVKVWEASEKIAAAKEDVSRAASLAARDTHPLAKARTKLELRRAELALAGRAAEFTQAKFDKADAEQQLAAIAVTQATGPQAKDRAGVALRRSEL